MLENCAYIQLSVAHSVLKLVKNVDAETKTVEALGVDFQFKTDDWDGLTKTAVFIRNGIDPIAKVIPNGQSCISVPWEILHVETDCYYEVGVIGIGPNSERMPTNRVKLYADRSCCATAGLPSEPTPNIYEQLLEALNNIHDYSEEDINGFIADYLDENDIATEEYVNLHANNNNIHITTVDRANWNGKANISDIPTSISDLTNDAGYITGQDISNKQDKLIAGTNITIDENNVISASGSGISSGDKHYVHRQLIPSNIWYITHNLQKYPSVSVTDSANSQVCGEITYINENELKIEFGNDISFSGKAFLN